jgi:hypothetical protein
MKTLKTESSKTFWRSRRIWLLKAPGLLLFLSAFCIGVILGLVVSGKWTTALVGLLGVGVGGALSVWTSLLSARETQRGQIMSATWSERVGAHQQALQWIRKLSQTSSGEREHLDEMKRSYEDARTWFSRNDLYLSVEARRMFTAILQHMHTLHLSPWREKPLNIQKQMAKDFDNAQRVITEGVGGHIIDEMLAMWPPGRSHTAGNE